MNVEIISVGTELLLGDILNTNAQYLSKELANLGFNVYKQVTVGDNIERLLNCFREAFEVSDVDMVITTGGLGPTADDITKEAAAKYFGQELILDENSWQEIREKCAKFSGGANKIPENNIRQAMFPKEADVIRNDNGTAPGALFKKGSKKILVLPGPPREMKLMFIEQVLPMLQGNSNSILISKYIRFFGIGESALEIKLKNILEEQTNPTVALYAKNLEVMIRVTAAANSEADCEKLLCDKIKEISNICGEYIYLIGDDSISSSQTEMDKVVAELLVKNNTTISVAESCTGGLVTANLINYPGISKVLFEGCVTYSNEAKIKRLGVKKETLEEYGAVSSQTAEEMAIGVAKSFNSEIGVSTTGIAGPDGGTSEKPVGLVYFGIYYKGKTFSIKKIFSGDRRKVRERAAMEALNQVRILLLKNEKQ